MGIKKINRTLEYTFIEAFGKCIEDNKIIITSKNTGDSYKIDKAEKKNKLKFYNPAIEGWQPCTYLLPEEIFDKWYITQ